MKRIFYTLMVLCCSFSINAQTLFMHLDGELPNEFDDKTGNNVMVNVMGATTSNGALVFGGPVINSYLSTDSLFDVFDINQNWTFESKVKLADSTDEIAFIDFRSTSQTGNMYLYYNRNNLGLHFSDRTINGDAGALVADYMLLPQDVWVTIRLEFNNGHLRLFRDGVMTADTAFTAGTLSPIAKTTIGYSEDRREYHELLYMDDVKLWGNVPASVANVNQVQATLYPNPASDMLVLKANKPLNNYAIVNVTGAKVMNGTLSNGTIDISTLAPGMYFIQATGKDGVTANSRFIKQ